MTDDKIARATHAATHAATWDATHAATDVATFDATDVALQGLMSSLVKQGED